MTPIDLRIKYRFETGRYPYSHGSVFPRHKDRYFTNEYGEWLETKQYSARNVFFKNTGNKGTFYNKHKDKIHYTQEYKEWMEERYCHTISILENFR